MTGETPLPIQEAPDVFQYLSFPLYGGSIGASDLIIMYTEKDCIIDAAFISLGTQASSTSTIKLAHILPGVVPASGVDFTDAIDVAALTVFTPTAFVIIETANFIPAGSAIGLVTSVASITPCLGTINLRIREAIR